jgi:DNA-binding CsgD family transcriptional regulator
MGRAAVEIALSAGEKAKFLALSRARKSQQGLALRARIVLAASEGLENKAVVAKLGASPNTVGKWR